MKIKFLIMAAAALVAACGAPGDGAGRAAAAVDIDASMAASPWPTFYQRAGQAFSDGRRDEAVTLFYIGQLRGRITVQCERVPPDRDPALLASLNATLGQTINEYAGGSPAEWVAAIDQALDWDETNPDPALNSARCRAERLNQRQGLTQLRDTIRDNAADIRRQRAASGLPNR